MSTFEVLVDEVVDVVSHPNADRLSLVTIRGYQCVSAKLADGSHRYKPGDLVVYVPEDAIVPEWLLKKGFWNAEKNVGMLAGREGNRVKAIKLRSLISQGILFSVKTFEGYDPEVHFVLENYIEEHNTAVAENLIDSQIYPAPYVGMDVADLLGITKYIPTIPEYMSGEITYIGGNTLKFDIENVRKFPHVIEEGTPVVFEEKLHGTFASVLFVPGLNNSDLLDSEITVTSKGHSSKGLVFKINEANAGNIYIKAMFENELHIKIRKISELLDNRPVYICGEIFGKGVQDLQYSQDKKTFAAFGIFVGDPVSGHWLNPEDKHNILKEFGINAVPVLYKGPYNTTVLAAHTSGKSTLDGKTVREGLVITPMVDTHHPDLGRVILKSISPEYLLRSGETTEFN